MSQIIKPQNPVINRNHPLSKGLVLDMPFIERGGTKTNEIASNANGILTSGVGWDKNIYGSGVTFPAATTDNISFSEALYPLFANGPFTFMAIVKPNSANSTTRNIFEFLGNGGFRSDIWIQFGSGGTNQVDFGFTPDGTNFPNVAWTSGWLAGSVHLVFGIWDGSTQRIYADNDPAFKVSGVQTTGPGGVSSPEFPEIGNGASKSNPWDGSIYSFRIWNRALSTIERLALYTNPFQIYQLSRTSFGAIIPPIDFASWASRSIANPFIGNDIQLA